MEHANPHAGDADRAQLWEMLVRRDIEAYVRQDWSMVADDFLPEQFFGFSARHSGAVDDWGMAYPSLAAYRDDWLAQAAESAATAATDQLADALLKLSDLTSIDIKDGCAVARKCFDGTVPLADGSRSDPLKWQTIYICRATDNGWKIQGFFGYLPYPLIQP